MSMTDEGTLNDEQQRELLAFARETIACKISGRALPDLPAGEPVYELERAVFVTLHKSGQLRGCIGALQAREPLAAAVRSSAISASTQDPRFPPVTADELPELDIEISVLSPLRPLDCAGPEDLLRKLRPGVDGVVLEVGPRRATFLPQVWEKLPDPEEFLEQLSLKAGLPPDGWADPKAKVSIYQVESFSEDELE